MSFKKSAMALGFVSVLALGAALCWSIDSSKTVEAATTKTTAKATAEHESVKMDDPVVAKVGKDVIKRSEVLGFIMGLPEQVKQMPLDKIFPLALDQVINNKIVGDKAAKADLGSDPEVVKLLAQAKEQIIRNVYVQHALDKMVTDADLKKAYDTLVSHMPKEEVHARHILVKNEADAEAIIKKLDKGAKFEDLAKQSIDGATAAKGGDLGWFTKTSMVPEFADAAFKLKPGTYTEKPVKTQFGWHVIKVEGKRPVTPPTFDSVKPQLEAQVRREKIGALFEEWQKQAGIEKFDIHGKPLKAETEKK